MSSTSLSRVNVSPLPFASVSATLLMAMPLIAPQADSDTAASTMPSTTGTRHTDVMRKNGTQVLIGEQQSII